MGRLGLACAWLVVSVGCSDGRGAATSAGTGTSAGTDAGSETGADEASGERPPEEPPEPARSCVLDDAWQVLEPMAQPRNRASAIVLVDGTVLVTGGCIADCDFVEAVATASVERFDPATDTWLPAPDMPQARMSHASLALADGDVLVIGHASTSPTASTDRYDLEQGIWSPGPALPVALGEVSTLAHGDLRVVLGTDDDQQDWGFRWVDGWQAIAAPPTVFSVGLWPWGDGMILTGAYVSRAVIYDPAADAWIPTPPDVVPHPDWETDLSSYVQASALPYPDTLFVLATTGGAHPEIGQQGVAAMLSVGADHWIGGAPGPFWSDTGLGTARSFAPGWVLAYKHGSAGEIYDAAGDRWCGTVTPPAELKGASVVLGDGSVLFTGGDRDDEPPMRWVPW